MRASSATWAAAWASASPKEEDERKRSSRKGRAATDDESGAGAGESAEGAVTASTGDEVVPEEQARVGTDEGDASSDTEDILGS